MQQRGHIDYQNDGGVRPCQTLDRGGRHPSPRGENILGHMPGSIFNAENLGDISSAQ